MERNFLTKLKNMLNATLFALKFVFSINKIYLFTVLISEMINTLKIFPYMYLLKIAIALLEEHSEFIKYITTIISLLLIILILELSYALFNTIRSKQKNSLDFAIKEQLIDKSDSFDYFTLSTKEYFVLLSQAKQGYEHECIEKNISLFFSIIANIVVLSGLLLTISSLGFAVLLPICVTIIVRILSEYFDRKANYIRTTQMSEINRKSNYLHRICEDIRFSKEIRIFSLDDKFDFKLNENSKEKILIWKKYMRIFRYSSATHIIADIILQLFIYLLLAYRVLVTKTIRVSDFALFFAAYQQIQSIIGAIASNNINIFLNMNYLEDFKNYWELNPLKDDVQGVRKLEYSKNDDIIIEFHNVSFRYPNSDYDALSDINVKLTKGKTYLIIGDNGAGKSTFVKLLCRLYSPTTGTITLNGKNIFEYDRDSYLSLLSVMFQDYKILDLSIIDNITALEPLINKDIFNNVICKADLFKKIQSLPNKERTPYSKNFFEDGIEFSGGETQKMMIAKTLYKNSPLKIFDEPTAGIDAISEHKIFENIKNDSTNGILIYITHRISMGVNSDNILIFSQGKIVETGNHKDLMSKKGIYASLFEKQATLYSRGD